MPIKIIDLTQNIEEGMQTYWGYWHPTVEISILGRHGIENRQTQKVSFGTHTGTHIDAPKHFIKEGNTVDLIPLNKLTGKAILLDFTELEDLHEISVVEMENKLNGRSPKRIVLRFDWYRMLMTTEYYTQHPFISQECAQWLVDKGCILIALDSPNPDCPNNNKECDLDSPVHKILLKADVVIVEGLINTHELTQSFKLYVAPLKITDGDGAPSRCFAEIDE